MRAGPAVGNTPEQCVQILQGAHPLGQYTAQMRLSFGVHAPVHRQ
jgi:hypothetical protein